MLSGGGVIIVVVLKEISHRDKLIATSLISDPRIAGRINAGYIRIITLPRPEYAIVPRHIFHINAPTEWKQFYLQLQYLIKRCSADYADFIVIEKVTV